MINCDIVNNIITFTNNTSIFDKHVLIITGQHGDEHTPLKIGIDLINKIKSNDTVINWDLYSQITIINGANIKALESGSRFVKCEDANLYDYNRSYKSFIPNNVSPTDIKMRADLSDLIIDIHSSPHVLTPFVALDSNCIFTHSLSTFCDTHNIRYTLFPTDNNDTLKQYCLNKNVLEDHEHVGFVSNKKSIKIAFTVETNGINNILDDDNACLDMILKIVNNAGKIGLIKSDKKPQQTHILTSEHSGIYIKSNYSNFYKKGDVVGELYSLSGEKIQDIVSNATGYVIQSICSQYISKDHWVSTLQLTSNNDNDCLPT